MNREMAEIIRDQHPVTLPPAASFREACERTHRHGVGAILVVDVDRHLFGIFTGRDAVRAVGAGLDAGATPLDQMMTRDPDCLPPCHTAIEALRLMRDGGFRHVPVIDNEVVMGVFSSGDFRGLEEDRLDEETGLWERL